MTSKHSRPINRARAVSVPCSASNRSSNGVNAAAFSKAWKSPRWITGYVFNRYTWGLELVTDLCKKSSPPISSLHKTQAWIGSQTYTRLTPSRLVSKRPSLRCSILTGIPIARISKWSKELPEWKAVIAWDRLAPWKGWRGKEEVHSVQALC